MSSNPLLRIILFALITVVSLPAAAQETVFGPDDAPPTAGWWQSTYDNPYTAPHCSPHSDSGATVSKKSGGRQLVTRDILLAAQPSYIRVTFDFWWGTMHVRLYDAADDTQVGSTHDIVYSTSWLCNQQVEWTGSLPQQFYVEFAEDEDLSLACVIDYVTIQTDQALAVELTGFTARPAGGGVMLEWSTASEVDNAGFNLWRCESKSGEFEPVNKWMIEALGGPTQSADYTFHDKTVEAAKTYYYKLEDVAYNGLSTYHGPISVHLWFGAGRVMPAAAKP